MNHVLLHERVHVVEMMVLYIRIHVTEHMYLLGIDATGFQLVFDNFQIVEAVADVIVSVHGNLLTRTCFIVCPFSFGR
ncbi:hypothetical protein FQZ97_1108140 [compost metagenome]